ncbi:alcohol dehydrogenase class IV [Alkalibaculum bacchi]|uniref:Alcohol dehydrogenase class IV n=1 Tax=Alkalibaculum bacchi TaxID=645887 RepID=A0A366HZC4_9FIRM|nr:iron-containing alcohol dehydrogenase [Alkalibaculum bacchi]RBP59681.1 alcohol dehydrogenase class IV [Alkalibaculum bacchi]
MLRFTVPRDIYYGENAIDHLKNVKGNKAILIFGSERIIKDGTIPKIQDLLKEANIETELFYGVESDPGINTVRRGAEAMKKFQPDIIVAIGGGSPIDAAKAMWLFYEYPEMTMEEATKPFSLPPLRQKAQFIAVSTTSGTGTEATSFSVITDDETNFKYPLADYNLTPDLAIADTNLVKNLTPTLVADTGMDALTHNLEAYVATAKNPISDGLSIKSTEMIFDTLYNSFKGDMEARGEMHVAQLMAGMSFSNAILGIVHSMAHKSSHHYGIAHGRSNAIYLPYVIQFNAKVAAADYADLAKRLGLKGETTDELVAALVQAVKDLRASMGMPASLKEFGVTEEKFRSNIDEVAELAVGDPCTGTNPRELSVAEMKKLFEYAYEGKEVDF